MLAFLALLGAPYIYIYIYIYDISSLRVKFLLISQERKYWESNVLQWAVRNVSVGYTSTQQEAHPLTADQLVPRSSRTWKWGRSSASLRDITVTNQNIQTTLQIANSFCPSTHKFSVSSFTPTPPLSSWWQQEQRAALNPSADARIFSRVFFNP